MTKVILMPSGQRVVVIEDQPDGICEECGKVEDVRPYGENFKQICFDCGMKNPELTKRMMDIVLFGE